MKHLNGLMMTYVLLLTVNYNEIRLIGCYSFKQENFQAMWDLESEADSANATAKVIFHYWHGYFLIIIFFARL